MFRLWGKLIKDAKMIGDITYENGEDDTRTHKVFKGLDFICHEFDLGKPIWLESNIKSFKKHSRTRFYQDSFIEEIPFDYLEIHIIGEDEEW